MNLDINPNGEIPENYTNWPRSSSEPLQLHPIQEPATNAANALLRGSNRVFDVEIRTYSSGDGFEQYSIVITNNLYDKTAPYSNAMCTWIPTNVTTNKEFAEHMAAMWCDFLGVEQKYKYIE
jgi:hypothetical protein